MGSTTPSAQSPWTKMLPLLAVLSRIDLTNCSEDEARRRLIKGVDMPAPSELKPAFEKIEGEPPDSQHAGPAEKANLRPSARAIQVRRRTACLLKMRAITPSPRSKPA